MGQNQNKNYIRVQQSSSILIQENQQDQQTKSQNHQEFIFGQKNSQSQVIDGEGQLIKFIVFQSCIKNLSQLCCKQYQGHFIERQVVLTQRSSIQFFKYLTTFEFDNLVSIQLSDCNFYPERFPSLKANNLKTFKLYSTSISDLSQFCKGFYPSLKQIRIYYQPLNQLNKLNAPNLKYVYLHCTSIKYIESFCQNLYPELQSFLIQQSQIKTVPQLHAPKLKRLQFERGSQRIEIINQFSLEKYSNLKYILFQNCKLIQIRGMIKQLESQKNCNLSSISLMNCQIKVISKLNTPFLERINLSYNQIENIEEFLKGKYDILLSINFSHNTIFQIPSIKYSKIEYISFSNNKILSLEQFLSTKYQNLFILDLSGNQITKISYYFYAPKLQYLYLSQNQINFIDFFKNQEKLKQLNLDKKEILNQKLTYSLNTRASENNNLNNIMSAAWKNLKLCLNKCKIFQNLLKISNRYSDFHNLRYINLSDNHINSIQFMQNFNLEAVYYLNLSSNLIVNYQTLKRLNIQNISSLNIQNNFNHDFKDICYTKMFPSLKNQQKWQDQKPKRVQLQIYSINTILNFQKCFQNDISFLFKLERNLQNIKNQNLVFQIKSNNSFQQNHKLMQAFYRKWQTI